MDDAVRETSVNAVDEYCAVDPRPTAHQRTIGPSMEGAPRRENITRNSILRLLSDDEIASVSAAQAVVRLSIGDEYIDLDHLDRHVQQNAGLTPKGSVLPRKAVQQITWAKIVKRLTLAPAPAAAWFE